MLDGLLERVREDVARLETTIAGYKSGVLKSKTMEDGKLVDTTAEFVARLEAQLADLQSLIAEWEQEMKAL